MSKDLWIATRMALVTLILTGLAYPLIVTGLAQLLFPRQADGSLVTDAGGQVVGSELIAQGFKSPAYFQPRPSAAGTEGYDSMSSGGSNLGPTSRKLRARIDAECQRLQRENPHAGPVPPELVSASGSGLDPHLSPEAALWQIPRIAAARKLDAAGTERVRKLVTASTEGPTLGFLAEPRVNVLLLNKVLKEMNQPQSK